MTLPYSKHIPAPKVLASVSTDQRPRAIASSIASALTLRGSVFKRDGALVEASVDSLGRVSLAPLSHDDFAFLVRENVEFVHPTNPKSPSACPPLVLKHLLNRPDEYPFATVAGVAHGALLRADGTLVTETGYDVESGYYVESATNPVVVPDRPTLADARAARDVLDDELSEFCFHDEPHRAGAIAALLTLFARPLIDGFVPMVIVSAPTTGSGKTTLLDVLGIIATGEEPPHSEPPSTQRELGAFVASLIREQHAFAVIDNVNGALASSALAAATTSDRHRSRSMRSLTTRSASVRTLFSFTGINVRPSTELSRRSICVNLKASIGPAGEAKYRHPKILKRVKARRSVLLAAVITILRHHILEGVDGIELPPWNSFESWSRVVRGAIVRVGYADPIEAMRSARDAADVTPALSRAFLPWLQRHTDAGRPCLRAQDLADLLTASNVDRDTEEVERLFQGACSANPITRRGGLTPTNIGVILGELQITESDGLRLRCTRSQGRHAWRVESVEAANDNGDGGGPPQTTSAPGLRDATVEPTSDAAGGPTDADDSPAIAHASDLRPPGHPTTTASAPQFDHAFARHFGRRQTRPESSTSGTATKPAKIVQADDANGGKGKDEQDSVLTPPEW